MVVALFEWPLGPGGARLPCLDVSCALCAVLVCGGASSEFAESFPVPPCGIVAFDSHTNT
jgi:hypothetical protein